MTWQEALTLEIGDEVEVTSSGLNKGKRGTVVAFAIRERRVTKVRVRPKDSFEWSMRTWKNNNATPTFNTINLKRV